MGKELSGVRKLWGELAARQFLRMPTELLYHYKDIGLRDEDLVVIMWIDLHQWGERAAFPHPAKLAYVLKLPEVEVVRILQDLRLRGYINLEETRNNSRNFHQDIRPLRNKLQNYLNDNPDHCKVIKRKSDVKRIDASTNKYSSLTDTSNSIDTSIPQKGSTTSLAEEINKKRIRE
jgi:hypothetical protein